jgi:hypothetical protein
MMRLEGIKLVCGMARRVQSEARLG